MQVLARQPGALEAAAAYRAGELTPLSHLAVLLRSIAEINPRINAIVAIAPDVEEQAARSTQLVRAGRARSALEGIPVLVKDNILVRGLPCVWGSRVYRDFVPEHDEIAVERLRHAGAVILGKSNVPEFALEGVTRNLVFGPTRNPYDLDLTPGGSSGGSVAAVAAGLAPLALGTDGGGSIRRPSSYTGLVGLKPSIGAVPRSETLPMILHDVEVIGPIARTARDARLLFDAIAGPDGRDSRSLFISADGDYTKPRILYVPYFGDAPVDSEIATSVDAAATALQEMGCSVEQGLMPLDLEALNEWWPRFSAAGVAFVMAKHPGKEALLSERLQKVLELGRTVSGAEYLAGIELLHKLRRDSAAAFERWDFIMTPSAAALPWPADTPYPTSIDGKTVGPRGHAIYTGWVNACGIPAINLPCTPSRRGLPIGFQLAAAFGADRGLLEFAARLEKLRGFTPP
jgi:aspartyl-tRNA(Asn)/glutamyl-tRNA(Gln) amidotransferase subunit A